MVKVGMTIEKIIKKLLWFEDYNEEDYCGGDRIQDEHGDWFYKITEEDFEDFRQAADVMRKYQELEQEQTAKNDLGVDAVSRNAVINQIFYSTDNNGDVVLGSALRERIARLPSVTPQLSSELEKNSKKLEKNFGELDCISRADARKAIIDHQYSDSFCEEHNIDHSINTGMALIALSDLPSVTPQEPRCKNCKWWKDGDGKFRRGCGAESPCPINTTTVYCGEGYCYMFSPKADMRDEENG